jgi:hypothetical protein
VRHWDNAAARPLPLKELGERYRRYRLADATAEAAMVWSLGRYEQFAPRTACRRDGVGPLALGGDSREGGRARWTREQWSGWSVWVVPGPTIPTNPTMGGRAVCSMGRAVNGWSVRTSLFIETDGPTN